MQARMISGALGAYKADHGRYPTESEGLAALLPSNPNSRNAYVDDNPIDPWGNPFVYRLTPTGGFQVYSTGPNGVDDRGVGDDIGPGN